MTRSVSIHQLSIRIRQHTHTAAYLAHDSERGLRTSGQKAERKHHTQHYQHPLPIPIVWRPWPDVWRFQEGGGEEEAALVVRIRQHTSAYVSIRQHTPGVSKKAGGEEQEEAAR